MNYVAAQNIDTEYNNYSDIWSVVDFLMTGDTAYISTVLDQYVHGATEAEIKTRQAKLANLWLPHYYNDEVTKLNSRVFQSIKVGKTDSKKTDATTNFTNTGVNLNTFMKKSLDSLLNYGGVAAVLLKINDVYTIKLVEGKHILSVCVSELGTVEYFKWYNVETVYDTETRTVTKHDTIYEYAVEDEKVVLYVTREDETAIIDSTYQEIPMVGTQLRVNDSVKFRGTPYFASLATNTMRLLLNSMSLDYLLDTVLTPRLVHRGATPIKKISNNSWRGVNIGPQDSLLYLEHSGSSLDAARDQLIRYKDDINSMVNVMTPDNKERTAYEVSMLKEVDNTIKDYIVDRYVKFLEDLFILTSFIHPSLKNTKVVYVEPSYLTDNNTEKPNNGTNTSNNPSKV